MSDVHACKTVYIWAKQNYDWYIDAQYYKINSYI